MAEDVKQGKVITDPPPPKVISATWEPTNFAGFPVKQVRDRPQYIKLLIYGRPGSGKTYLAAQAQYVEAMSPVLYLVPDEAELDTLRRAAPDAYTMQISTWAQMEKVWSEARRLAHTPGGVLPFRTVVVDTGTEAQKLSMGDIMRDLLVNGRPGGGEVNVDVPSVREWGQSTSQIRRMVRAFRDLPVNFIMTCHETTEKANNGVTWTLPDLPGKLKNQIAGMFSNVFYLYVKAEMSPEGRTKIVTDEKRCLLTGLTEGFVAKSRSGAFPRVVVNQSMAALHQGIVVADMEAEEEAAKTPS